MYSTYECEILSTHPAAAIHGMCVTHLDSLTRTPRTHMHTHSLAYTHFRTHSLTRTPRTRMHTHSPRASINGSTQILSLTQIHKHSLTHKYTDTLSHTQE